MNGTDIYQNNMRWFVGVIKNVDDPLDSGRVQVRIKGTHSEDPQGDGGGSQSSSASVESGGSQSSTSLDGGGTKSSTIESKGLLSPSATLPSNRELDGKISKSFSLRDVTTGATVSGHACTQHLNELTPEIIKNLATLSVNCLDPLKEQFNIKITSGWRPASTGGGSNHPFGIAADIQSPGTTTDQIKEWITANLKGRYNLLEIAPRHIHIQLGSQRGGQGTTSNPYVFRGADS